MIRPLRDLLVLRPINRTPGKVGYLWMPDCGNADLATSGLCEVVAVGPGARAVRFEDRRRRRVVRKGPFVPCACKVGDRVQLKAYDGKYAHERIVEHEGEQLIIVRERDIVGIVEK